MLRLISTAINKELDSGRGYDDIYQRWRYCVVYCAMNRCKGSATEASQLLKVHRNTLAMWIREMHAAGFKSSDYDSPKGQAGAIPGEVRGGESPR